jgi:hypothetical protein
MLKKGLYFVFSVILSTAFAIVLHTYLPGGVGAASNFDGLLVVKFGFQFVAALYFVVLCSQAGLAELVAGSRSSRSKLETGIRFGLAFGLIYFVGMFEPQPGTPYTGDFANLQFWVGLGDMLAILFSCLVISFIVSSKKEDKSSKAAFPWQKRIISILSIAVIFFTERLFSYSTGITISDFATTPIPIYIWTIAFGLSIGIIVDILRPYFGVEGSIFSPKLSVLTIGLNWIWFNSFIGLISKGMILSMLSRSMVDTIAIYVAVVLVTAYFQVEKK